MRVLIGSLMLVSIVGCAGESQIPAGSEAIVESARTSLITEQGGLWRSLFLFRAIRCRADGGRLVEFEQSSILGSQGWAYAMQGPNATDWGGGWGISSLDGDQEINWFFSESPEAQC